MAIKHRILFGTLLALAAYAAPAQQYTVTDLGVLGGQFPGSTGTGINASGQVTGYSSGSAFITEVSTNRLIPLTSGQGLGINASGQVTGYVNGYQIAFITDPTTNAVTSLGSLVCGPGILCAAYSGGTAINDSGQVTGYSALESSAAGPRAIITDATTHAMTNLAEACGCQSQGLGINAAGQVTGWMRLPSGSQHAFITDPTTRAMVDIGTLGGSNSTGAGINASGQVTGNADGPLGNDAFLYSNGVMLDLGTLGGVGSQGLAINASGQIVGTAATSAGVSHAFFYSGNAMIDLNAVIGTASDSYTLSSARAINDQGQIVANGVEKRSGLNVAFVLTPVVSAAPTASIAVASSTVAPGQAVRVTFFSTGATSCTPSGGWASGLSAVTGHADIEFQQIGRYTLGLSCTGPGGAASASTILTVMAPPVLKLAATDIPAGSTVQISWTGFPGATSCSASRAWSDWLPASGTKTVGPFNGDARFELTCYGNGITLSAVPVDLTVYRPIPQNTESMLLGTADIYAMTSIGTVAAGGGLDGHGYAINSDLMPYPLVALDETFDIARWWLPTGAAKQTIGLSTDRLNYLTILATGVNGNQPNQKFVVTYQDGSSTTYIQSVSDWGSPQNYPGETVAAAMASRITPTGTIQQHTFNIYAYRIPLDSTKQAMTLKLPANRNVILLGLNESLALRTVQIPMSSVYNVNGISTAGQAPGSGGMDGHGYALEADLIPATFTWSGQPFAIGGADQPDAASRTNIVINGGATRLTLLATGLSGNQPNATFLVTYQDGTTTLFKQGMSDWHTPQGYAGESVALGTAYRVTPAGGRQTGPWNVYAYTFVTDPNKTISSLTLPPTRNVVVLAVDALTR